MRRVLPLMVATLATHGTAVTLEGLLLARKVRVGVRVKVRVGVGVGVRVRVRGRVRGS